MCFAVKASAPVVTAAPNSGTIEVPIGGYGPMPSIARDDSAFSDNNYWRGRIWGPMLQLTWWGFSHDKYSQVPGAQAAKRSLEEQGRYWLLIMWLSDGKVMENYNGVHGWSVDVGTANPFYHWGALAGWTGLRANGLA